MNKQNKTKQNNNKKKKKKKKNKKNNKTKEKQESMDYQWFYKTSYYFNKNCREVVKRFHDKKDY